jgi:dynactin complex subunit
MAIVYQLDFFEESETSILKARMEKCEESASKVRKSLFAKNGELKKKIDELEERLTILERNICHS